MKKQNNSNPTAEDVADILDFFRTFAEQVKEWDHDSESATRGSILVRDFLCVLCDLIRFGNTPAPALWHLKIERLQFLAQSARELLEQEDETGPFEKWGDVLIYLVNERPLLETWLTKGIPILDTPQKTVLAFLPEHAFVIDCLARYLPRITEAAKREVKMVCFLESELKQVVERAF